jgi:hypothetical protein
MAKARKILSVSPVPAPDSAAEQELGKLRDKAHPHGYPESAALFAGVGVVDADKVNGEHYHDSDGEPCSLLGLIRREPEWAATRIKQGEIAEKKLATLSSAGVEEPGKGIQHNVNGDI